MSPASVMLTTYAPAIRTGGRVAYRKIPSPVTPTLEQSHFWEGGGEVPVLLATLLGNAHHWRGCLAMSARASRLRLEEELRKIVEQEESLNGEVNELLQVKLRRGCVFVPLKITAAVVPLGGRGC